MKRLGEIKEREEALQPGPWFADHPYIETGYKDYIHLDCTEDEIQFIAHAREDIPRLVKALEEAMTVINYLGKERNPNTYTAMGMAMDAREKIKHILSGESDG